MSTPWETQSAGLNIGSIPPQESTSNTGITNTNTTTTAQQGPSVLAEQQRTTPSSSLANQPSRGIDYLPTAQNRSQPEPQAPILSETQSNTLGDQGAQFLGIPSLVIEQITSHTPAPNTGGGLQNTPDIFGNSQLPNYYSGNQGIQWAPGQNPPGRTGQSSYSNQLSQQGVGGTGPVVSFGWGTQSQGQGDLPVVQQRDIRNQQYGSSIPACNGPARYQGEGALFQQPGSSTNPGYLHPGTFYQGGNLQSFHPGFAIPQNCPLALLNDKIRDQIYIYVFSGSIDTMDQNGDPTTPQTSALIIALRGNQALYQKAVEFYFGNFKWVFNATTCNAIMALGNRPKRSIKHLKIARLFFLRNDPADPQNHNNISPIEASYMLHTLSTVALFSNFPALETLTLHFPLCEFHELGFACAALQVCPRLVVLSFQRFNAAYQLGLDFLLSQILGVKPGFSLGLWPGVRGTNVGGMDTWKLYTWAAGPQGWGFDEARMLQVRLLERTHLYTS